MADLAADDLHPILCRACDGCLGDCRGLNPGCPVTKRGFPPIMWRVLAVYAVTFGGVVAFIVAMLWSNGTP